MMVKEKNYLINEAAKEVHVESHVLRYWEEELRLPIKRNEQGHRIYTQEDIDTFITVKKLKDQGLQLKAVKMILDSDKEEQEDMKEGNPFAQKHLTKISKNGEMKVIQLRPAEQTNWKENHMIEVREKKVTPAEKQQIALKMKESARVLEEKEDKYVRMQYLLQKMIQDAVEKSNEKLLDNLSVNLRGDMCKELDYQFRLLEERENARNEETRKVQEEHYKHVDELLTQYRGKKNGRKEDSKVKKEFRLWRKAEAK